ncbi:heme NO-binding domain-containing protein [Marinovum sp. 2_MG-2023]|uniref:heme NO-binding domain-containing protein n=1 Tax=Roseobacteraceae TaxID=2854170 RepID=UPI001FD51112|nr:MULTISPECIES: heme NO-binding domain-containing protein [Roseobacteraceae]MCJ7871891.1 heme NO-binding domain-containing protein [Phaeobacter sp. J2-8]MDO6728750.1 heme NO-binding domain-containing protein [Marinovum sp. 2_MG-2023]MDO6777834.1 heme NO-binding domain-containing protein [Marinovum sp. 1_MG-2023]
MHGLINRAIQCFYRDTYGALAWGEVVRQLDLDFSDFEPMLHYDSALTHRMVDEMAAALGKEREAVLEDVGTYLISNPEVEAPRRLLRFGGVTFLDFLHSLDDLPDRARLAVEDLELPLLELRDHGANQFSLLCSGDLMGFGHVLVGVLRAMADDYGALVFLEHTGVFHGAEVIEITLIEAAFAEGRSFELGVARAEGQ